MPRGRRSTLRMRERARARNREVGPQHAERAHRLLLASGRPANLPEVAEALGVSRGVAREALKALVSEGRLRRSGTEYATTTPEERARVAALAEQMERELTEGEP